MAEEKGSLRDRLIHATVDTLIFGGLLLIFGFWLNMRLERYKNELANDTEKLKSALQITAPLIQRRFSGYLEIQQAARPAEAPTRARGESFRSEQFSPASPGLALAVTPTEASRAGEKKQYNFFERGTPDLPPLQ
jgi:hypothetical protein